MGKGGGGIHRKQNSNKIKINPRESMKLEDRFRGNTAVWTGKTPVDQ